MNSSFADPFPFARLLNAAQNIGSLVGLPFAPYVTDGLGRRAGILIGSVISEPSLLPTRLLRLRLTLFSPSLLSQVLAGVVVQAVCAPSFSESEAREAAD